MSLREALEAAGFKVIVRGSSIQFPRQWGAMSILCRYRDQYPKSYNVEVNGRPWVEVQGVSV